MIERTVECNPNNLSVLSYANGFTLWHYTTAEDQVGLAGYFNRASDQFRSGDVIECSLRAIRKHVRLLVDDTRNGEVTVVEC